MNTINDTRPWYKEFWPWFVMLFPASAVVGGFITYYVAATNNDGVVEDDYYKQGMTINRTLTRDKTALAMELSGELSVTGGKAVLVMKGNPAQWPERLHLRILHPTRAGMDQNLLLESLGNGQYTASCSVPDTNKWKVLLEDEQKNWRLAGQMEAGSSTAVLKPVK